MRRIRLLPYKSGSESARVLSRALGIKRIKTRNSRFVPRRDDIIINWGNQQHNYMNLQYNVINKRASIIWAANKLTTLEMLAERDIPLPEYTIFKDEAKSWFLEVDNVLVYCRRHICGQGGSGIVIATEASQLVDAPLYTLGIPCRREYRVHVFNGEVILTQRKSRRIDSETDEPIEADVHVRNHSGGWIFQQSNFEIPDDLHDVAIRAVSALGLVFGAVDVVRSKTNNKCYVLEVNTACGMSEGSTTVAKYAEAIRKYIDAIT
jgi:glutathione synthase/RimK-type ligase-like ATP-grasp enzyme